ncbi:MAG: YdcF family protein [Clostridia bacterium]|nr:YdcF family protein [Clostridia bacterium]
MIKFFKWMALIIVLVLIIVFIINFFVIFKTKDQILEDLESFDKDDIDCILVLGAGVRNGQPTHMLEDRLLTAIDCYNKKLAPKIIMSGDHGQSNYDEVNVMKNFAIQKGVPSTDIFMDHAGFSSYESIYRAKEIFGAKKIVIITQKYHLYRSLYIADSLGLEAYGVQADLRKYIGQSYRELREIIARDKDCIKCILKPKSKYLGETIPVNGDGDITNDK